MSEMNSFTFKAASFLFLLLGALNAAPSVDHSNVNLSDYMELCSRADPLLDECLKKSFQDIRKLSAGIKEIGLVPFDPLDWQNIRLNFANPILPLTSLIIDNVRITGLSAINVLSVKTKITDSEMRAKIEIEVPKIFIEGTFRGKARYPTLDYSPRGKFNCTAVASSATFQLAGRTEERNGETFMILRKFHAVPTVGNARLSFEGLFPDPSLDQIASELFNNNLVALFDATRSEMSTMIEPFLLKETNSFFSVVPYKKMFL